MARKMGFHGKIYYGASGSTAATEITNSQDINYNLDPEKGETTVRGDGNSVPIVTEDVTALKVQIEWTMVEDTADATLTALKTAAKAGSAVAIRTLDYAAGKGFDGDVTMSFREGKPLKGTGTWQFTATPTYITRAPQLYV